MIISESYSQMLRQLSNDYYYDKIQFQEYRARRRIILDKIDEDFNGLDAQQVINDATDDTSIFMQTAKFFKSSDLK